MVKVDLHQIVDRLPDQTVDGTAIESDQDFLAELDERTKPLDADA